MGTLASLMDLARQSLMANQAAINVTSNNVANQNTSGYTRQVVNWQARDSVTIGDLNVGGGASVNQASVRDRVLEQRVQQQTQLQTQSQALESALQQVQNIFGLSSTSTSATTTQLGSTMDSFFNALSSRRRTPPMQPLGKRCSPRRTASPELSTPLQTSWRKSRQASTSRSPDTSTASIPSQQPSLR
jgi:flagellar hook-associated protein 1 FlgK